MTKAISVLANDLGSNKQRRIMATEKNISEKIRNEILKDPNVDIKKIAKKCGCRISESFKAAFYSIRKKLTGGDPRGNGNHKAKAFLKLRPEYTKGRKTPKVKTRKVSEMVKVDEEQNQPGKASKQEAVEEIALSDIDMGETGDLKINVNGVIESFVQSFGAKVVINYALNSLISDHKFADIREVDNKIREVDNKIREALYSSQIRVVK